MFFSILMEILLFFPQKLYLFGIIGPTGAKGSMKGTGARRQTCVVNIIGIVDIDGKLYIILKQHY